MNLSIDPWIPVVLQDRTVGSVNLEEAFEHGSSIRDLAVRPHERIALMRLLLCIAHASMDDPDDQKARVHAPRLAKAVSLYLGAQRSCFELFGKGSRFLQFENLVATNAANEERGTVSKLDLALATGNNSTLFDNSGGSNRKFTPAQLALMLLTYQCFSPSGTIGVALWSGKSTLGGSDHSPCIADGMLHAFPQGPNLASTIHLNLCSAVERLLGIRWGRPVWEMMPTSFDDELAIINATKTYLGRLVPISRAIRLAENGDLLLANGLGYPKIREASATIMAKGMEREPLRASLDKALWRVLNALTTQAASNRDSIGGPIALNNLSENEAFDLWVGALVVRRAKVLDTVESVYHLPATMLLDTGQKRYEDGIDFAEAIERNLKNAVSSYRREVGDNLATLQHKATFQYWTQAEQMLPQLLDAVKSSEPLQEQREWAKTLWGQALGCFAHEVYKTVCPHETGRQIRAFVKGLRKLSSRY